jgi:hypothetical protein
MMRMHATHGTHGRCKVNTMRGALTFGTCIMFTLYSARRSGVLSVLLSSMTSNSWLSCDADRDFSISFVLLHTLLVVTAIRDRARGR